MQALCRRKQETWPEEREGWASQGVLYLGLQLEVLQPHYSSWEQTQNQELGEWWPQDHYGKGSGLRQPEEPEYVQLHGRIWWDSSKGPKGAVIVAKSFSINFEKFWEAGEVLSNCKKQNTAPIYKRGKAEDPWNHWLVSPTLVPSKIIEQILLETVLRRTENEELLHGS